MRQCVGCGSETGVRRGFCGACDEALTFEEKQHKLLHGDAEYLKELGVSSGGGGLDIIKNPAVLASLVALSFMLQFTILFYLHPTKDIAQCLGGSLYFSLTLVSAAAWIMLWVELLQDNLLISILSFFIPIAVYSIVAAHPDRAKKPFTIHIVAGCLAVGVFFGFEALFGGDFGEFIYQVMGNESLPISSTADTYYYE